MKSTLLTELTNYLKKERHFSEEDRLWREYFPLLTKISNDFIEGARKYFEQQRYQFCTPSVLVGILGACENFDTVYKIKKVEQGYQFLSQTAQLQLERALSFDIEKIACFTKSFRNEINISDGRHLREFTLIELELANVELSSLLDTIESCIKNIIQYGLAKNKNAIEKIFGIDVEAQQNTFLNHSYQRISYTEAIKLLHQHGNEIKWGDDLSSATEAKLSQLMQYKPFFITHFPKQIKFFNMRVNRDNQKVVNSADLILPISGEAVGSAEREFDFRILKDRFLKSTMYEKMKKIGISEQDLGCYFKIVEKKEMPHHAGCGIGFERVLQSVLSLSTTDIRLFSQPYIMNRMLGIFV